MTQLSNLLSTLGRSVVFGSIFFLGCSDGGKENPPVTYEDAGTPSADKGVPKTDGKVALPPDASTVDIGPTADAAPSTLGKGCNGPTDCGQDAPLCLTVDKAKGVGICSRECKPDDADTPLVNEDDCSSGYICGEFRYANDTTYSYCLQRCNPSLTANPCPASSKATCDPASTRFSKLDQAVCWFPACTTNADCPVNSATTCVADKDCAALAADAFCNSGICAKPGVCSPGGICGPHGQGKAAAKIGDPCATDFDCANSGFCLREGSDTSAKGLSYHNGYCSSGGCAFATTVPEFACAAGSTCNNLFYGGVCQKSCDLTLADDCRGFVGDKGGDYECFDWSRWSISNVSIAATPVCVNAGGQGCDTAPGGAGCSGLAGDGNTTNMTCRDRETGLATADPMDPKGICLDDTASGTFVAPPTDAGVVDAAPAIDAAPAAMDAGVVDAAPAVPDAVPTVPDAATVPDAVPTNG